MRSRSAPPASAGNAPSPSGAELAVGAGRAAHLVVAQRGRRVVAAAGAGVDRHTRDVDGRPEVDHDLLAGRRALAAPHRVRPVVDQPARPAAAGAVVRAGEALDRRAVGGRGPVAHEREVDLGGRPVADRQVVARLPVARGAGDHQRVEACRRVELVVARRARVGGQLGPESPAALRVVARDADVSARERLAVVVAHGSGNGALLVARRRRAAVGDRRDVAAAVARGEVAHAARTEHVPERAVILVVGEQDRVAHVEERRLGRESRSASVMTPRAGSAPSAVRRSHSVSNTLNEGSGRAFVLSLKAGGAGLNLTAASHVIHFDRWWNPAVENQATDRAFRIGQTKNVLVHKFVCRGTVEEKWIA